MKKLLVVSWVLVAFLLWGCGDSDDKKTTDPVIEDPKDDDDDVVVEVPDIYEFKNADGASTVEYTGQAFRQVLVRDLGVYLGTLTKLIDEGNLAVVDKEVYDGIEFFYSFDSATSGNENIRFTISGASLKEVTYNDISTNKNIKEKFAGNDAVGQYKNWLTDFKGWSDETVDDFGGNYETAEGLLLAFFHKINEIAKNRTNGVFELDPSGANINTILVDSKGRNYHQLIQKFLLGSLCYSQALDDYLDDDLVGKGIGATNVLASGKKYTDLAHGWDEGFGYFGGALNYKLYTSEELAATGGRPEFAKGFNDLDGDGKISVVTEFNYAMAAYAGKRDVGSNAGAKTTFAQNIIDAFLKGRHLIQTTEGELNNTQFADLKAQRDIISENWEKVFAANIIHYANSVLVHMSKFDAGDYSFTSHANHWSEMKGFALSLQFNRLKKISDADFVALNNLIGDAPVLGTASAQAQADYKAALNDAKALLKTTYGFDDLNMGDANGLNGWK